MTIYERAIIAWGVEFQLSQAMEEAAELLVAISHYKRESCAEHIVDLLEEIADVELMIEQIIVVIDGRQRVLSPNRAVKAREAIEGWKKLKIKSLEGLLEGAEHGGS